MKLEILQQATTWFTALPWYWKLLAWVVVVLAAILAVLVLIRRLVPSSTARSADTHILTRTDNALKKQTADLEVMRKRVADKRAQILDSLQAADLLDTKRMEDREKILAAGTMAELDRLQKELGL